MTEAYNDVSHPSHYCFGKYEPKDVIRDWGLNFNLGSAIKYIARAGRKDDIIQDLSKAKQFLEFEIEALERERKENTDTDFENAFNGSSGSLPFEDNGDYDERFEYISKALDNDMLFYEQFKDKIKSGIHDIFETQDEKYLDIADMVNIILEYFEEV